MARWTSQTKLLKLMEELKWDGITNWTDIKPDIASPGLLRFKQWLRSRLDCISPLLARQHAEEYYLNEGDIDGDKGGYTYLQRARSALYAAYKVEQEFTHGTDS